MGTGQTTQAGGLGLPMVDASTSHQPNLRKDHGEPKPTAQAAWLDWHQD